MRLKPAPKIGALQTARWLLKNGLFPVATHPLTKRPVGQGWGKHRPSRIDLDELFKGKRGLGVGLLLGPVGGVVDLEVDGPGGEQYLASMNLPKSIGWKSKRGPHVLLQWDRRLVGLPAAIHMSNGEVELRIGGEGKQLMSVCPPTVGADRKRRRWQGPWEIASFPEALLRAMEKPVHAGRAPLPHVPVAGGASRYAEAALRNETRSVAEAVKGTRNRVLNRAAFSLGTLVGAGALERESVEADLIAAALTVGLPEREARATVKSGMDAGIKKPRR